MFKIFKTRKALNRRAASIDARLDKLRTAEEDYAVKIELREKLAQLKIDNAILSNQNSFYEEEIQKYKQSVNELLSLYANQTANLWSVVKKDIKEEDE